MRKVIGSLGFSIVLVLAFAFVGFGADNSAVSKYEDAKRIAEEKLEKLSKAVEQLPSDRSNLESHRPQIEKANRLLKDFETAFLDVARWVPKGYELDHDKWANNIMKRLEAMGLR